MRAGSGPASTTTARPGPVASTSPSPWPTSQATNPQPGSGQVRTWVGTAAPTREHHDTDRQQRASPGLVAQPRAGDDEGDRHQRPAGRHRHRTGPGHRRQRRVRRGAGHPGDGEGRQGGQPAQPAGHRSSRRRRPAPCATPSTVAGATNGAASEVREDADHRDRALQQHDHRRAHQLGRNGDREGRSPTADPRRQHAGRSPLPTVRRRAAGPASPGSTARSRRSGPATGPRRAARARPPTGRAGRPRRREVLRPSSPTAPIAAARTTLGSGRTRTTNAERGARPRAAVASDVAGPAARRGRGRRPARWRRCCPHTADRWVMPVTSIASSRSCGVREVSPMTSAGQQPSRVGRQPVGRLGEAIPDDVGCPRHPAGLGQERRRSARSRGRRRRRRRRPEVAPAGRWPRPATAMTARARTGRRTRAPARRPRCGRLDRRPARRPAVAPRPPRSPDGRAVGRRRAGRDATTPRPPRPSLAGRPGRGSVRRPECPSRRPTRRAPTPWRARPASTSRARRLRHRAGRRRASGNNSASPGGAMPHARRRVGLASAERRQATARCARHDQCATASTRPRARAGPSRSRPPPTRRPGRARGDAGPSPSSPRRRAFGRAGRPTPRTAAHQTLTFGRICSSSLSPMPLTSPSSSTEANRPCCCAPVEDALRENGADAGQRVQCREASPC